MSAKEIALTIVLLSIFSSTKFGTNCERLYQAPDLTSNSRRVSSSTNSNVKNVNAFIQHEQNPYGTQGTNNGENVRLTQQNQSQSQNQNQNKAVQQQQNGNARRDWVNPNPPSGTTKSTIGGITSSTTPWPNLGGKNPTQAATSGNKRDWVNPNLNTNNMGTKGMNMGTSSSSSTTPWPALGGGTRNQGSLNVNGNANSNNAWNKPLVPKGPPKSAQVPPQPQNQAQNKGPGSVSLDDVLKIPSYNPGWNVASSTTPKTKTTTKPPVPKNPTDTKDDLELREFADGLLKKDVNNAAKFITINFQERTSSQSKDDKAPKPLLAIKPEAWNLPTVSKVVPLHNNYVLETTESEYSTPQEKSEENALLDAILSTSIMQTTRNFLIQKGKISKDPKDFRDLLRTIWFNMYARGGGKISSSGFEHVFLAEIKNQDVSGLHNWIYFNEQESKQKANYLGYLKKIDLGTKGAIVKYHFTFNNLDKPVGSMFIGTSPELEMALYSTCFVLKPDVACPVRLNGQDFTIRTYTYRYRGKNMIGSAFPEI